MSIAPFVLPSLRRDDCISVDLPHLNTRGQVNKFFKEHAKAATQTPAQMRAGLARYSVGQKEYRKFVTEAQTITVESFWDPFLNKNIIAQNRYGLAWHVSKNGSVTIQWNFCGSLIKYEFNVCKKATYLVSLQYGWVELAWEDIYSLRLHHDLTPEQDWVKQSLAVRTIFHVEKLKIWVPIDALAANWVEKFKDAPETSPLRFTNLGSDVVPARFALKSPKDLIPKDNVQ